MVLPLLAVAVVGIGGAVAGWKAKKETNKAKLYVGFAVGGFVVYKVMKYSKGRR